MKRIWLMGLFATNIFFASCTQPDDADKSQARDAVIINNDPGLYPLFDYEWDTIPPDTLQLK